jgi:hypothetical protein
MKSLKMIVGKFSTNYTFPFLDALAYKYNMYWMGWKLIPSKFNKEF